MKVLSLFVFVFIVSYATNCAAEDTRFQQNYEPLYLKSYLNIRDSLQSNANALFNNQAKNISSDCLYKVLGFIDGLQSGEKWTEQVLDSFGKPKSGILLGSLFWDGDYVECLGIRKTFMSKWASKYCVLGPEVGYFGFSDALRYGICMDEKCNNEDIAEIANAVLSQIPSNITSLLPFKIGNLNSSYVHCRETQAIDGASKFAILLVSIIIGLVVIATVIDLYIEHKKEQKKLNPVTILSFENPNRKENETHGQANGEDIPKCLIESKKKNDFVLEVLTAFSAYKNAMKILDFSTTQDHLSCLNAIKYISISWIVLAHVYQDGFRLADNPAVLNDFKSSPSIMLLYNALFSVDTFFLLSGTLTSYLFLKEVGKPETRLTFSYLLKYYMHRYLRLTPPYVITILISALILKHVGSGPYYPTEFEVKDCKDTWWSNLLYINNLYFPNYTCISESWFLANIMQFHCLAPIILIPLSITKSRKSKLFAFTVCAVLLVISTLSTSLTLNAYPGSEKAHRGGAMFLAYYKNVYIKPWCRIDAYVIGLVLGYFIYRHKMGTGCKLRTSHNFIGWVVSLCLAGYLLFAVYPDFNEDMSRSSLIIYETFHRIAWSSSVAYIIYACASGNGGYINKFLSLSIWAPLSRLSYCIFLFHPIVYSYYYYIQVHPIYVTNINMVFIYAATLSISIVGAFIISLCFELPFIGLERLILKKLI